MHKVLIVWDARNAPRQLTYFIDSFKSICSDYDMDAKFLSICTNDFNGVDRCQYGMRALLDAVHYHMPDLLISMGSEANLLAKLIKPALKIPLICNNIPANFEFTGSVKKRLDKLTNSFTASCSWSYSTDSNNTNYLPPSPINILDDSITIIKEDPIGPVLANIVQQHGIEYHYISCDTLMAYDNPCLLKTGIIIMSSEMDKQQSLATYAATCGITTIYVGTTPPLKLNGKFYDDYQSVMSTKDINLINIIKDWKQRSQANRYKQATSVQVKQSIRIGIIKYIEDLGFKNKKTTINTHLLKNIS